MSKLLKSNDVKLKQLLNIAVVSFTLNVLNPLTSNEIKPVHEENIPVIVLTFDVSKPLKSNEINPLHLVNILFISVTPDVSIFHFSTEVILVSIPLNCTGAFTTSSSFTYILLSLPSVDLITCTLMQSAVPPLTELPIMKSAVPFVVP